MRSIPPAVCLLAALTLPRAAWSAQAPLLEPGARVRLYAPSLGGRLTGTLVAWESDTLVVRVDGEAEGLGLVVPADSVTRLDVSRGKRPMTLEGAGVGMLGGALLALIASPDWVDENGECTLACLAYEVSPHLGTRVAVLSLLGALLGGPRRLGDEGRQADAGAPGAAGRGPDTGRRACAGGEDLLLTNTRSRDRPLLLRPHRFLSPETRPQLCPLGHRKRTVRKILVRAILPATFPKVPYHVIASI